MEIEDSVRVCGATQTGGFIRTSEDWVLYWRDPFYETDRGLCCSIKEINGSNSDNFDILQYQDTMPIAEGTKAE